VAVVQYTFTHKQYIEQHNRHKQYIEQHNSLIRKSALTTEEKAWYDMIWYDMHGKSSVRVAGVGIRV